METIQPKMSGHFLTEDDKRSITELLDKTRGLDQRMMTLPTTSTIVNVFPGDLRDWFAGQAMAGLCANSDLYSGEATAGLAYLLADAMIAVKEAKK